jgi:hypothetical protein
VSELQAVEKSADVEEIAGRLYRPFSLAALGVRDSMRTYLLGLVIIWVLELAVLLVLQVLGTGMGLRIRQMGEDRVWADGLQFLSPSLVPKNFWLINDRNPLSPWWYLAAKPLIYASPYGIYLVRKLIDLLCAVSVFLLVDQVGRGKHRLLAAACAVLTLFWSFSGYSDQIMWNFLGVLALSALTLWTFCKYVDSGRASYSFLIVSLLIYLFAIGTYTLQASSFVGIFALALFRGFPPARNRKDWLLRVRTAVLETGFFVVIFAIYTMIWYTAARENSDYYRLSPDLIGSQLISSVGYLWWHFDYPMFLQEVRDQWSGLQIVLVGGLLLTVFSALFWRVAVWEDVVWRRAGLTADRRHSLLTSVGFIFAISVGLAAATVILEATSNVWFPGLRARMIQQIFQPLLYLGILFALLSWFPGRRAPVFRALPVLAAAGLCTVATIVSFQYNRDLNHATTVEERFEAGLKALVPLPTQRTKFIVRMAPGIWHNSDSLSDIYVQTFYNSRLVNMRVLQPGPPIFAWQDYTTVVFGPDEKGVLMADSGGTAPMWIPYSQVRIVSFDGDKVALMNPVASSDLIGLHVGFDRQDVIQQNPRMGPAAVVVAAPCTYSALFSEPLAGTGWSVPERTPDKSISFQWMASDVATLKAAMVCDGPAVVKFRIVQTMAGDILDGLRLEMDGEAVTLARTRDAQGATVLTGLVSEQAIRQAHGSHLLRFQAPRTIVPEGGTRTLAVAFDQLVLQPATGRSGT